MRCSAIQFTKRTLKHLVIAIAASISVGAVSFPAQADPIPAGEIRMDGLRNYFSVPGGGYAGEFLVNASRLNFTPVGLGRNGVDGDHFVSFCVETTEDIRLNRWYDADLNTESRNTYQTVQAETAYLYSHFIKGDLAGYKYFDDNTASGSQKAGSVRALQEVIWYFQDPAGFTARYGANAFASGGYFTGSGFHKFLARSWYSSLAGWIQDSGPELNNVRIINIWEGGNARQDTLVMIPLPPPFWMACAGLGISGGLARRRRRHEPSQVI